MRYKKIKITPQKLNPPHANINVTPLVDVVLVLLIVFMVLTPLLEKNIAVQIPEDSWVENRDDMPEGQLLVSLDNKGYLYLNQESIEDGDYVLKLRGMLAAKNNPAERVVFFSADGQAHYEKVVFALDGARQAGAVALGLLTAPVDKAPEPALAPVGP
ncbi:MAG: biopolymer transporter ExbD [Cystobacterineae bacterium]|nr:biopolymer transporter ExbD [Cystobacterineae bacterium]